MPKDLAPSCARAWIAQSRQGRKVFCDLLKKVNLTVFITHLTTLEDVGLLRPEAQQPEPRYGFRHALIQDAAYSSLFKADRRIIHQVVGEALETLYPEQLVTSELAPQLARHFAEAQNPTRAFYYAQLAADLAAARYANAEAIEHYTHAIAVAQQLTPAPATSVWQHLYTRLGRAFELNSQYERAVQTYTELHTLAQTQQNSALELTALTTLALAHSVINGATYDPALGDKECKAALALARQLGDEAAEAKVLWIMLLLSWFTNYSADAQAYGEQALALARRLNLREQMAYILNDLGAYPYSSSGDLERAVNTLEEAVALWRELHNLPMLVDGLNHLAGICLFAGQNARAYPLLVEGKQVAKATGNAWGLSYNISNLAHFYINEGRIDEGLATLVEALRWGEESGMIFALIYPRLVRILVYLTFGALETAAADLEETLGVLQSRFPPLVADTYALRALLQLQKGDLAAAEADLATANAQDTRGSAAWGFVLGQAECALLLAKGQYLELVQQARSYAEKMTSSLQAIFALDGTYYHALALRHLGQASATRTLLEAALPVARAVSYHHYLQTAMLADIAAELGDPAAAQAYRAEARQVVHHILAHTSEPVLRAALQSQPLVQTLLTTSEKSEVRSKK